MDFNQVVHGDAVEVLQYCPDDSIRACITSPPYANQRQHFYPSISESDYPAWTVHWLEALRPKLKNDGSILIIHRAHQKDGEVASGAQKGDGAN